MGKIVYILLVLFIVLNCHKIPTDVLESAPIVDTLFGSWTEWSWNHDYGEHYIWGGNGTAPRWFHPDSTPVLNQYKTMTITYDAETGNWPWVCYVAMRPKVMIPRISHYFVYDTIDVNKLTRLEFRLVLDELKNEYGYHMKPDSIWQMDVAAYKANWEPYISEPPSGNAFLYISNLLVTAERK